MNWPAYADYVESNVPWLGALPAHWTTPHLGHITDCLDAVRIPLNAAERAEVPGDVPYWGANGVVGSVDRSLVDGELVLLGEDGAPFTDRTREKAFFVNEPIWPNNHIHVLRPSSGLHPKFLTHALNATDYSWFIEGSTREKLTQGNMSSIPIALPPTTEQCAIVDFLDRETAKIDALIAKQEQLIATLREDRAATITQAVTKGLDPDVEMKDSGVERLGAVPSHWVVPQVGWHTTVGNGATPARDNQRYWMDGTIPWLNSGQVNRDRITDADQFVTDTAMLECHLPMVPAGSVLVGLTGQGKTRGMASLLTVPSTINQHLAYLTPASNQVNALYLLYVIRSAYDHLRELSEENGSTKGGLTCTALRKLRVPLPPVAEQRAIAEFLVARCARIDALIDKSTEMIETLREYRSALITDAVTGKIDVQGVA